MPLISDLVIQKEPNKRFKKTAYRPWDNQELTDSTQELAKNSNIEILPASNITLEANEKTTEPLNKTPSHTVSTAMVLAIPEILQFSDQILEKEFRGLFGAQKIVLQYLLTLTEEKYEQYVITKSVTMNEFTLACHLPPNTIKAMLQKLKHKNFLLRHENKPGRGGYARYRIVKSVYDFFSNQTLNSKTNQVGTI